MRMMFKSHITRSREPLVHTPRKVYRFIQSANHHLHYPTFESMDTYRGAIFKAASTSFRECHLADLFEARHSLDGQLIVLGVTADVVPRG
jgi:hypothetical protein